MISLLIIFLGCLLISAFFSGSEMAFVSSNEYEWREEADDGDLTAKRVIDLQRRPEEFLTAVLIGNNIVNIAATSILTYMFQMYFNISNEWIVTAVMVPLIVIFCEMVPKDYTRLHGKSFLGRFINILSFFSKILEIPASAMNRVVNAFFNMVGIGESKSIFVSEKEFRMLIEESTQSGVIERHEKQLIDMILDFERTQVASVMTPIDRVQKVSIDSKVSEVIELARKTKAQMVLVYEEIPTLVVGMVYVFDLLFVENQKQGLKEYLRSPTFLPQNTSLERAFLTLQQRRQSYAVVTDYFGEVCGAVPIEKLLAV